MFHAVSHFGLRALPHESSADSHFSPCFLFADALCLHLASTLAFFPGVEPGRLQAAPQTQTAEVH